MTDGRSAARGVPGDMLRAAFVAGNVLLALLAVGAFIAAVVNLGRQGPGGEEVVARIGGQQAVILGLAATASIVALVQSIRLWLRGSWHVVSVLLATFLVLAALALLLFYTVGMGQH